MPTSKVHSAGSAVPAAKAKTRPEGTASPAQLIDARVKDLGGWRGEMLSLIRSLIKEADAEVTEEWKWRGVPVWSHDGIICTGETYKKVVKEPVRNFVCEA